MRILLLLAACAAAAATVRITHPIDGAIVNRHDGAPRIEVRGEASADRVVVNGRTVKVTGGKFAAPVTLTKFENSITAEAAGSKDRIVVLWDRDSYKRFRVSIDDNIRWLKDIALHNPPYKSIFENEYLAFWREMNRKYGAKVHFNIYYEMRGFNLEQMPDRYRDEWKANADWLRLSFHARANDPDRPYENATAEQIRTDYRLVNREIERFAGREVMSHVTTIHWGAASTEAVNALRAEGVKVLAGYFEFRKGVPAVSYDLPVPIVQHLSTRDYWKDTKRDLLFVRHDMVLNGVDLEKIVPRLEALAADPHQSEVLELMIHEQHWYPDFKIGYRPDYRQRMETAIRWAVEHGYKPAFFGEGFLGAQPRRK